MELDSPVKISDQSYTVAIHVSSPIETTYPSRESGTHTTPPDSCESLSAFIKTLAEAYEAYSKKWFYNQVPAVTFMKRLAHIWRFESHQPYSGPIDESNEMGGVIVRQQWIPEQLHILPRTIQIHWVLQGADYSVQQSSGADDASDSIPLGGQDSQVLELQKDTRERALRKVRQARLQAAVARWQANELARRYYERYGAIEHLDGKSILSSDEEDAAADQ